jgi:hypoxanthine phosphoribosyltransferase
MIKEVERILISEQELQDRVKEMGRQITEDYKGKNLLVVSILKGAVIFASDLVMEIKLPLTMDFMAVSSYGASTKSSGVVRILKDLDQQVADKERTITGAIIILAHMLKLKVVAEGVETYHQYEFLSSQGCDLLQGFFFSEPKRAKELEDDILNNGLLLDQIGRA